MLQQWTAGVNDLFYSLHGHTVKSLICFSFAMCLAGHCHSGKLALMVQSQAKPASSRRRWERLIANSALDAEAAIEELAFSLLKNWTGRKLLLVLDETPNGEDLRCMRIGVAYRKRLLSLAAECYPTDSPPLPMPKLICRLLRKVAKLLPRDCTVTLLTDRGLSWPAVLDCCRKLGWGHVMRLQHSTRVTLPSGCVTLPSGCVTLPSGCVTLPSGCVTSAGKLVKHKGQSWHGHARIFKKVGWRNAHVTAVWDPRSKEPWLLAAREDGSGGLHAALAYAKRNWCEQTFRDEKSSGFQWQQSRITDPIRAFRLVLVMILATLLSISLGTWLIKTGRRKDLDPHRQRRLSLFQLGLRYLHHLMVLSRDTPIPPYLPYLHPS
jgi:hypothetical protein